MSEHKLRFTWKSPHVTGLCSMVESSQWGWKETRGQGTGERGTVVMKTGQQEEGTVTVDKASVESNQCCKVKCEHPPTEGSPWIGTCKRSLELHLSISFEARFVINRVCQQDYRISHSLPYKTTYMRVTFFAFSCTHPSTHLHRHDRKSNVSGIVVSFTEDAKGRKEERKKDSLESSKLQRTVEVCSHQGLEWAGICWYRMSALYVEQYNADWGVHTSASSSPAHSPLPHHPPPVLYKGAPFRSAVTLHNKQFDIFWFQHSTYMLVVNCGLNVAPCSAQSTTTLMLKKCL